MKTLTHEQLMRSFAFAALLTIIIATSTRLQASQTGTCGGQVTTIPFDDVLPGNTFFCAIAEAYFSGLTNGTSPTSYSPAAAVPREQMAAFVTRTLDQSLRRGSRRAALKEFWAPKGSFSIPLTSVGFTPIGVACDGADLWVANLGGGSFGNPGTVSRVRASDGKLLETWTGADGARRVLVAKGRIYVVGNPNTGAAVYRIDPTQPAGAVATLTANIGLNAHDIAFDGDRIWITSNDRIYLLSFGLLCGPCVTAVTNGLLNPRGLVYDGTNMWVTDTGAHTLNKLDADGNVTQSVPVGANALTAVFDGTNVWVPNNSDDSVSVVRATTGALVATLTGNGLDGPSEAAFDGERILVIDSANSSGNKVSLWKAADLSPLGSVQVSFAFDGVAGVCSDGLNFWITLSQANKLARF